MTFSSFDAYPGVLIWHSRDLVNWQPVTAALKTPIGSVWACELIKHDARYYIYLYTRAKTRIERYAIRHHRYGVERNARKPSNVGRRMLLRITGDVRIHSVRYAAL